MAALGPFERRPRLAVAVSGGPDSVALWHLASRWAEALGGSALGLHVDHGLRPGSAVEAGTVSGWLGGACRVLRWTGEKPAAGIQAAAREARYGLLEEACRGDGILHLLLAHHADDLAETARIRAERGSGEAGLAGMAAVRERPGLRLLRPLLGVRKARLLATLRAARLPWLEDPSNVSPRFRRGRLRAEAGGHEHDAWFAVAARAGAARAEGERRIAAFAAEAVTPDPLGFLAVALDAWRGLPAGLAAAALARCAMAVAGRRYPPRTDALERAAALLAAAGPVRLTLGGARLVSAGARLFVIREAGRIADRRTLPTGGRAVWDGRFAVAYRAGPGPALLAPLLDAGRLLLPPDARDRLRARGVPAPAVAALPALWLDGVLAASPVHAAAAGVEASFAPAPAQPVAPAPFAAAAGRG